MIRLEVTAMIVIGDPVDDHALHLHRENVIELMMCFSPRRWYSTMMLSVGHRYSTRCWSPARPQVLLRSSRFHYVRIIRTCLVPQRGRRISIVRTVVTVFVWHIHHIASHTGHPTMMVGWHKQLCFRRHVSSRLLP